MKITITESQAWDIMDALEWAINPEFGKSDKYNRRYQRIIDKIKKELD